MNKRIKELSERCTSSFVNEYGEWEDDFDKEKFAELLVQECVNVLHDNELWSRHISHALNEHFGVKE